MNWFNAGLVSHGVRLTEAGPLLGPDPDWAGDNFNPARAYRSLTSQGDRSLEPLEQDRMFEIAAWQYDSNPLAHRIIELLVDFVVGEGFTYKAGNDALQEVLDEFWNDPINAWPIKQFKRVRQLFLFGEATWPAFVRASDGRVRLGYIDPANIKRVTTDPNNAEILTTVQLKSRQGVEPPPIPIIRRDEAERSSTQGLLVGQRTLGEDGPVGTFFFAINNLSNAARGRSDLLCSFDWLDLYDKFLFGQAERATYYTDMLWDVTLDDMSEDQIKGWLTRNTIPRGSSMRAHNQKVHWQAIAPDLHATDVSEQARTMRMQTMISNGFPEAWIFTGADTNRSTLDAQGLPVLKSLSKRQKEVKAMVQYILEFVRDCAIQAGRLPRDMDDETRKITVEASEVSTPDLAQAASTLKDVTAAALVGEQQHYFTKAEAAMLCRRVGGELGVELPPLPEGLPEEAQEIPEEPEPETVADEPIPLPLTRAQAIAQGGGQPRAGLNGRDRVGTGREPRNGR